MIIFPGKYWKCFKVSRKKWMTIGFYITVKPTNYWVVPFINVFLRGCTDKNTKYVEFSFTLYHLTFAIATETEQGN